MDWVGFIRRIADTDAGLLRLARSRPVSPWRSAVIGLLWAIAVLAIRYAASTLYQEISGFIILLPGVILAALAGGRIAGLTATAACLGGGWLIVSLNSGDAGMGTRLNTVATVNFIIVGVFCTWVGASLRKIMARLTTVQAAQQAADARIDETEVELRAMIDQAAAGIVRVDMDGAILSANARFAEMLGLDPNGVVGIRTRDVTHPDDIESTRALLASALAGGAGQVEKRYLRPDGSIVWAVTSLQRLLDHEGRPRGFIAVVLDISEAKATEASLRESEERFRLMADTAPSPVWLTNEAGDVEFVNKALVAFYGKPAEDLLGQMWRMTIHPDDVRAVAEVQGAARPHHRPYAFECRFQRHDGAWRWSSVSVNPRFDGDGAFRGYVGMAFDVTEKREALDALAAQERRQSFLLALSDRLRQLTGTEAVMAEASRSLGQHLGVTRAGFGELNRTDGVFRLYPDWTDGTATSAGEWPLPGVVGELERELQNGVLIMVEDVDLDPRTAATTGAYQAIGVRAFATTPLMRGDRLQAFMNVHSSTPRIWTAEEMGLLDDVAERTWAEVERARAQAEVAESEARFRAIADTAPVLIWVTREDRARAFVNQAYVAFMGGDYETVRLADWRSFIHPEDQDRLVAESLAGEATREPFSLEARYLRHDGEYRWLKSFSRPRFGIADEVIGFVGVAFDVTDIRESNARLATLAAERDAILGQLGEGVIVTDREGAISFVNDAASRLHGVADLGVTPEAYSETYHLLTDDGRPYPPLELPLARAVLHGEIVTDARWRIRRPDGTEVIAVGNARPVTGPDGARIGAVLTLRDETARIDAEHRISESEARFRTIADSAPVFIWMTDADTRIVFVNQRYTSVFGVDTGELMGERWQSRVHPDDLEPFTRAFMTALKAHGRFEAIMRVTHPTEGLRWLRSEGIPRFDAAGVFQGYVGASLDITEARRAEDDLKRINELLEERVGEALAEKAKAEADLMHAQRMEAVGRLTGGVAHDFNNLLTVVIGALDMMLRSPDDAARRKKLGEAALAAARRGEGLTHQLLAFSRRQALRPQAIDLNAQIHEGEPLLRRAVGETIDLRFKLRRGGARVNVDPSQFEAALINLLVNARDAVVARMGDKPGHRGRITVQTLRCEVAPGEVLDLAPGEYVCVTVADNGAGMDADTLVRVFEPFFTTKAIGKGTGLGLSQVYGFARQSGGAAKVISAPGKGAEIHLYLPPLDPTDTLASEDESAGSGVIVPGTRLLLVEDDLNVSAIAVDLLTGLGFEVEAVETGPEALQVLAGGGFDVMVSDVVMPGGMTGIELARLCGERHSGLPILLTSGYAGDDVDEALADAPWPFLRKPYSSDQLREALGDLLALRGDDPSAG
jgi:PAS domain S-box-containing protein